MGRQVTRSSLRISIGFAVVVVEVEVEVEVVGGADFFGSGCSKRQSLPNLQFPRRKNRQTGI